MSNPTAENPVIVWTRNANVESWIKQHGASFEYHEDYPRKHINVVESRKNQARLNESLDEIRVARMERLARTYGSFGQPFGLDCVIGRLNRACKPPMVLGDGNHRDELASKLGLKTIGLVEVIGASDDTWKEISHSLNTLVGRGQTEDVSLQHAINLLEKTYPQNSIAQVAAKFVLDAGTLGKYFHISVLYKRFAKFDDPLFVANAGTLPRFIVGALYPPGRQV